MITEQEIIKRLNRYVGKTECSCETCRSACMRVPCIGTPWDILRIMESSEKNKEKVSMTINAAPWENGITDSPVIMVAPETNKDGSCVFLKDGMCSIHEIKPIEGKYSYHELTEKEKSLDIVDMIQNSTITLISKSWTQGGEAARKVFERVESDDVELILELNKGVKILVDDRDYIRRNFKLNDQKIRNRKNEQSRDRGSRGIR